MDTIKISDLQALILKQKILWTEHVSVRMRERKLKRADVIACMQNGKIIEQYLDDTPYPSCLIFGYSKAGKPLHIVCSHDSGIICCIITAYIPTPDKWENDFITRKVAE